MAETVTNEIASNEEAFKRLTVELPSVGKGPADNCMTDSVQKCFGFQRLHLEKIP